MVWVRFPELTISRYYPSILRALGNLVGKTVKIDDNTQQSQRGKFARVAVDVNISVLLRPRVELDGELINVAYEGLPSICFWCGIVGHESVDCSSRVQTFNNDQEKDNV